MSWLCFGLSSAIQCSLHLVEITDSEKRMLVFRLGQLVLIVLDGYCCDREHSNSRIRYLFQHCKFQFTHIVLDNLLDCVTLHSILGVKMIVLFFIFLVPIVQNQIQVMILHPNRPGPYSRTHVLEIAQMLYGWMMPTMPS